MSAHSKKFIRSIAAATLALAVTFAFSSCGAKNGSQTTEPAVPLSEYSESKLVTVGTAEGWIVQSSQTGVQVIHDSPRCNIIITVVGLGSQSFDTLTELLKTVAENNSGEMLKSRTVNGVEMSAAKYVSNNYPTLELRGVKGTNACYIQVFDYSQDASMLDSDEVAAIVGSVNFL